jgi:hypothetical protein
LRKPTAGLCCSGEHHQCWRCIFFSGLSKNSCPNFLCAAEDG